MLSLGDRDTLMHLLTAAKIAYTQQSACQFLYIHHLHHSTIKILRDAA
jgi:hypothetical protein